MTGQPGVAVIIAAYNAGDTIARAVLSALAEDRVEEVIVVDDGSRDDTAAKAQRADDGTGRLAVVSLSKNGGPAVARNVAIRRLRSPYFCILDADDYFLPGRIARLLASTDADWDMLADDLVLVQGQIPDRDLASLCEGKPADAGWLDVKAFVAQCISRPGRPRRELGYLKPLIRRAFVEDHALSYDESLRLGEDYAFYLSALIAGAKLRLVGACGYIAIERADSLSARHTRSDVQSMLDFDDRILTSNAKLTDDERAVLAAHRRNSARKADYLAVLDCSRDCGRLAALAMLAQMPSSAPYILADTARAKVGSLLGWIGLRPKADTQARARLMIGLPRSPA